MLTGTTGEQKQFKKHVEHALGSLAVEMDDRQLEEKFIDQCDPVLGQSTKAASDACWRLAETDDVSILLAQL